MRPSLKVIRHCRRLVARARYRRSRREAIVRRLVDGVFDMAQLSGTRFGSLENPARPDGGEGWGEPGCASPAGGADGAGAGGGEPGGGSKGDGDAGGDLGT